MYNFRIFPREAPEMNVHMPESSIPIYIYISKTVKSISKTKIGEIYYYRAGARSSGSRDPMRTPAVLSDRRST